MIKRSQWQRPASSGEGDIFSQAWVGEGPRAVLQIAHGMAEHSDRYDAFARFLAEHGYAVYMNDHAGHGKSARIKGHFADKNGWESVVEDMKRLMDEAAVAHPGLPLFLMGHSMGSFLSRSYIIRHGGLAGCVLMGTMGTNPAVGAGKAVARIQMRLQGPRTPSRLIEKLSSSGYLRQIENPVNKNAWLSTVDDVALAYEADEDCGFPFTTAGYDDLFTGLTEISRADWAAKVPAALPILLIAGDADPVGRYGKGPREVYNRLRSAGHDRVTLKLYQGMRHELLNEAGKQTVYADILAWLEVQKAGE